MYTLASYKASVCGCSLAEDAVSIPSEEYVCLSVVSVVCCAGRGLCVGLITRTEENPIKCGASLCLT